jgi:hypothetical protein
VHEDHRVAVVHPVRAAVGALPARRLDEPADETILIPVDVFARAPLPAIDDPPASPLR